MQYRYSTVVQVALELELAARAALELDARTPLLTIVWVWTHSAHSDSGHDDTGTRYSDTL